MSFLLRLVLQLLSRRLQDLLVVDVPSVLGQQQEAEAGKLEALPGQNPETGMLLEVLEIIGHVAGMGIALSVATVATILAAHVELSADGGGVVVVPTAVVAGDFPLASVGVARVARRPAAETGWDHGTDVILCDLELHVVVLSLDLLGFKPLVLTRRVHKKASHSLKSFGWRS